MTLNRIPYLVSILYAAAIVISLFTGGIVPVLIVGAVIVGLTYSVFARGRLAPGVGRNRNRNRSR